MATSFGFMLGHTTKAKVLAVIESAMHPSDGKDNFAGQFFYHTAIGPSKSMPGPVARRSPSPSSTTPVYARHKFAQTAVIG
jgi:hypothetical protein